MPHLQPGQPAQAGDQQAEMVFSVAVFQMDL